MWTAWIWIISIIATMYIADQKKIGMAGFVCLSVFTGPLAVIIALLVPARNGDPGVCGINGLEGAKQQLHEVRNSLRSLEAKANRIEELIVKLSSCVDIPAVDGKDLVPPAVDMPLSEPGSIQPPVGPVKRRDMELDFGRNWLSKIGIAVLALGVAFLISYSFKYFGPFLKISFGYVVGGALFVTGLRLEGKERLRNFGRALLGGAWAIIYFTTYAMYHFEASRIVTSQGADVCLLALVVAGMMAHVWKYQSERMMSVVLFVAYLTSTIGQISMFTLVSLLFLAVLVLFLVYRFQWVKTLSIGIILTYGIHVVWVVPNLLSSARGGMPFGLAASDYYVFMNFIFLSCYWAVFFAGVHVVKVVKDPALERSLAVTNFANIAAYSILAYPLILKLFDVQRSVVVFVAGLLYLACAGWMKKCERPKMFVSDIVAAVFAMTFAVALKFLPATTLLVWMIEVPFLLFIGVNFKEKIFRYCSYALAGIVALRLVFLGSRFMPEVYFLGVAWVWYGFMCFWASISMAVCFYLTRTMKADPQTNEWDVAFDHLFSFAAAFYFSFWVWSWVSQPWTAFSVLMQGIVLTGIGVILGLRRFRVYAYLAMLAGAVIFLLEAVMPASDMLKWLIVSGNVLTMFGFYGAVKRIKQKRPAELFFEGEAGLALVAGLVVLVAAVYQYVPSQWDSLCLGFASVAVILTGFFDGNKTERMGGMALLALTLGQVVLVDLSGLDIVFKIITLIVLGVLFLGVSYIYNRFSEERHDDPGA